jgi:hypothetical protein
VGAVREQESGQFNCCVTMAVNSAVAHGKVTKCTNRAQIRNLI